MLCLLGSSYLACLLFNYSELPFYVTFVCFLKIFMAILSTDLLSSCLLFIVIQWFSKQTGRMLTVRDLLSWIDFVNVTGIRLGAQHACLHGVFLVFLDGLSLGAFIVWLYLISQFLLLFINTWLSNKNP